MKCSTALLGDLLSPAPIRRAGDGDYPILSMTMRQGLVLQSEKFTKRIASRDTGNYRVIKKGELVVGFPIDEAVLSIQRVVDAGIVSPAYEVWRVNTNRIDDRFLERYLRSNFAIAYYKANMRGTTARRKTLPHDKFKGMPVPLPKINEQRRIAAILDEADAIRRKREQSLALADDLLKSAFLEMFGDLEHNDRNWPTEPLGKLLSVRPQNGLYKPSNQYGMGTRILRIDGFYDGYLENEGAFKRLAVSSDEQAKYGLNNGDIVINRVNSRKYLGKSALVEGLGEPTVFESNMMRFAVATEDLEPRFLVDQLQTEYIKRQILTCSKDAVNQSSINQRDVESFRIRKPPIELQRGYSRFVKATHAARLLQRTGLSETTQLIASLSQRAFRGEL